MHALTRLVSVSSRARTSDGAGRDIRGRVCSPERTAYSRLDHELGQLELQQPHGLHQHGFESGTDPQIDTSARRCTGLGMSFNGFTHGVMAVRDPLDRANGEAGMIVSRSR